MPSWYALKRHVRKSALVQVREHLGGWLRFFFGTLGLFDFLNKTKLELYYTCMSRRYFVHQYIIFRDFVNYEILVRKSYSEYKFWDEWHGFYLAGLSLPISSYLRQQIEYHAILWWTNQRNNIIFICTRTYWLIYLTSVTLLMMKKSQIIFWMLKLQMKYIFLNHWADDHVCICWV